MKRTTIFIIVLFSMSGLNAYADIPALPLTIPAYKVNPPIMTLKKSESNTSVVSILTTVEPACTIATQTLDFGSYSSAADDNAATTMQLTCSPGTKYNVYLDGGHSGNTSDRYMEGPVNGSKLHYNVYTKPCRKAEHLWKDKGEVSSGSANYIHGTMSGTEINVNVYGKIPQGQQVPAGNYSDELTVTVDYN